MLWIRIALNYKVAFLNKPLAFYNQDVDGANRGVGRLHQPQEHMLWNLGFLEEEEIINSDYKQLIDNLRTYMLFPYYLSKDYHEDAKSELAKVDWGKQTEKMQRQYRKPLAWLRTGVWLRRIGSRLKQLL